MFCCCNFIFGRCYLIRARFFRTPRKINNGFDLDLIFVKKKKIRLHAATHEPILLFAVQQLDMNNNISVSTACIYAVNK